MPPRTRRLLAASAAALLAGSLVQAVSVSADAAESAPVDYKFLRAQVFTVPGVGSVAIGMPTERRVMA